MPRSMEVFEGGGKHEAEILDFAKKNDLELRVMDAMGVKRAHPDSQTEWIKKYADEFMKVSFNSEVVKLVKAEKMEEAVELAVRILKKEEK